MTREAGPGDSRGCSQAQQTGSGGGGQRPGRPGCRSASGVDGENVASAPRGCWFWRVEVRKLEKESSREPGEMGRAGCAEVGRAHLQPWWAGSIEWNFTGFYGQRGKNLALPHWTAWCTATRPFWAPFGFFLNFVYFFIQQVLVSYPFYTY